MIEVAVCIVVGGLIWFAITYVRQLIRQLNNMYAILVMVLFNEGAHASHKAAMESYIRQARPKSEKQSWGDFAAHMTAISHEVTKSSVAADASRLIWLMNQVLTGPKFPR